jgi:TPR repeat protein/Txe/YoeB family toxin of Txe-Axe toxin-antitoxin module
MKKFLLVTVSSIVLSYAYAHPSDDNDAATKAVGSFSQVSQPEPFDAVEALTPLQAAAADPLPLENPLDSIPQKWRPFYEVRLSFAPPYLKAKDLVEHLKTHHQDQEEGLGLFWPAIYEGYEDIQQELYLFLRGEKRNADCKKLLQIGVDQGKIWALRTEGQRIEQRYPDKARDLYRLAAHKGDKASAALFEQMVGAAPSFPKDRRMTEKQVIKQLVPIREYCQKWHYSFPLIEAAKILVGLRFKQKALECVDEAGALGFVEAKIFQWEIKELRGDNFDTFEEAFDCFYSDIVNGSSLSLNNMFGKWEGFWQPFPSKLEENLDLWVRLSLQHQYPQAQFFAGLGYYHSKEFTRARELFEKCAQKIPESYTYLGKIAEEGLDGQMPNADNALDYYLKASKEKRSEGVFEWSRRAILNCIDKGGDGTFTTVTLMALLGDQFKRQKKNLPVSKNLSAMYYYHGLSSELWPWEQISAPEATNISFQATFAIPSYRKAAALGYCPAMVRIARLLLELQETEGYEKEALFWLEKAQSMGHELADEYLQLLNRLQSPISNTEAASTEPVNAEDPVVTSPTLADEEAKPADGINTSTSPQEDEQILSVLEKSGPALKKGPKTQETLPGGATLMALPQPVGPNIQKVKAGLQKMAAHRQQIHVLNSISVSLSQMGHSLIKGILIDRCGLNLDRLEKDLTQLFAEPFFNQQVLVHKSDNALTLAVHQRKENKHVSANLFIEEETPLFDFHFVDSFMSILSLFKVDLTYAYERSALKVLKRLDENDMGSAFNLIRAIYNKDDSLGKPEPLKGDLKGFYSRRINAKDRLVYQMNPFKIMAVGDYH